MSAVSDWIDIDPQRMGGVPCVRGTRVPAFQVVRLLGCCSDEEIVESYPTVPVAAVAAIRAEVGERCSYCDDTGDVHRPDGEWLGTCGCPAGDGRFAEGGDQP